MTYPVDSLLKVVEPPSATKQQTAKIDFSFSPNPVSTHLQISMDAVQNEAAEICIFDLHGREVRQAKWPKGKAINQRFEMAGLPAGQYFARIISGNRVGTKRFIKQ